jgi:DNA modification methylase
MSGISWKEQDVLLTKLRPFERNPRKISRAAYKRLKDAIGRAGYHQWQHEPCWYAVRCKGKGHWSGDRKQTTIWNIANRNQDTETVHGTQKPVECMKRPIENNSAPGDKVYEPFSGSGTTLIACELTARQCFAMELDPLYVDMAVRRWQQFTGANAVRQRDHVTFEEAAAARAA